MSHHFSKESFSLSVCLFFSPHYVFWPHEVLLPYSDLASLLLSGWRKAHIYIDPMCSCRWVANAHFLENATSEKKRRRGAQEFKKLVDGKCNQKESQQAQNHFVETLPVHQSNAGAWGCWIHNKVRLLILFSVTLVWQDGDQVEFIERKMQFVKSWGIYLSSQISLGSLGIFLLSLKWQIASIERVETVLEDESESEYDHQEAHTGGGGGGALSLCAEVEAAEKRWRVLLNYLSADWLPLTNKKTELKAVDLDALNHHYTGNLQADKFKVACADSNKQNSRFHSCCVHVVPTWFISSSPSEFNLSQGRYTVLLWQLGNPCIHFLVTGSSQKTHCFCEQQNLSLSQQAWWWWSHTSIYIIHKHFLGCSWLKLWILKELIFSNPGHPVSHHHPSDLLVTLNPSLYYTVKHIWKSSNTISNLVSEFYYNL